MIPTESKLHKHIYLSILILVLLCLSQFGYLNSLSNQFVYDDGFIIVDNYFIKTWKNLFRLLNKDYFRLSAELSYRPVVTLSYFIDFTFWKLNPSGFHLTNTLLHTLNSVLLFFLLAKIFNCQKTSFIAALIFSCHPVLTEAVNAVSYREDLLTTTFFIASFILYVNASGGKRPSSPTYFASVACYLLGVFSKEMAITLPLFVFIYDVIFSKRQNLAYKLIRYYIGFILATVFYLLIRFVVLHNPIESHVSYPEGGILVNFLTMSKVVASYIKLFVFPVTLCADYVVPYSTSLLDTSFILSFILLANVVVIVYRLFFHSKILFFSVVWFFVSLLPVLNIVPIENIMAERYLYLPIVGFCMLIGILLLQYQNKINFFNKPYTTVTLSLFVLLIFSYKTIKRNKEWMNETVLWTTTAKVSPRSFKAHNNIGNIYRSSGRLDKAIFEYKHTLALNNNYFYPHLNLGTIYSMLNMHKEAFVEYQKALQINPCSPDAHNNLGVLYVKLLKLDFAITEFKNAISNKPEYSDAHCNLGYCYLEKGLYKEAINECVEAIKYNDHHIEAYYNLTVAYLNDKQPDKALEAAGKVLSIDPYHEDTHKISNLIYELLNSKR